jgi:hypothetical protein
MPQVGFELTFVRGNEDSSCLRQHAHCDQPMLYHALPTKKGFEQHFVALHLSVVTVATMSKFVTSDVLALLLKEI